MPEPLGTFLYTQHASMIVNSCTSQCKCSLWTCILEWKNFFKLYEHYDYFWRTTSFECTKFCGCPTAYYCDFNFSSDWMRGWEATSRTKIQYLSSRLSHASLTIFFVVRHAFNPSPPVILRTTNGRLEYCSTWSDWLVKYRSAKKS